MELTQIVKKLINVHSYPDYAVDGIMSTARYKGKRSRQASLNKVKSRTIVGQPVGLLIDELVKYSGIEESVVDHRLKFNESLTESEELEEFYDPELTQKPENNLENWRQLGTDLGELRHFSDYLAFDTINRQFFLAEGYGEPNGKTVLDRVNGQLILAQDLSVVVDPDHISAALADRSDYVGKKLAPSLVKDKRVKTELNQALGDENFLVVGPKSLDLAGDNETYTGLQAWFNYYTNPTLDHLVLQEQRALEQDKEVAVASQIGIDTARGNLRGVKNVAVYVASAYVLANAALLGAKSLGADIDPKIVNTINSLAIVAASYIPSYNEVAEIAGGINVEQIFRVQEAYKVGKEKGDMSLYRRLAANISSEQTFQQYQIDGWLLASGNTLFQALSGNLDNPAIFAITMSMQVSANNWLGNIAMWLNNHYSPMLRQRRREYVANHPEAIKYFGLEAVVDPEATDEF